MHKRALLLLAVAGLLLFVNGCCGAAGDDPKPNPAYAKHRVVLFTKAGKKDFGPKENALLDEFAKMGFNVQRTPGGGGSNEDANVKVGEGEDALATVVAEVVAKHYPIPFAKKPVFDKGDTDIFINLGPAAK